MSHRICFWSHLAYPSCGVPIERVQIRPSASRIQVDVGALRGGWPFASDAVQPRSTAVDAGHCAALLASPALEALCMDIVATRGAPAQLLLKLGTVSLQLVAADRAVPFHWALPIMTLVPSL